MIPPRPQHRRQRSLSQLLRKIGGTRNKKCVAVDTFLKRQDSTSSTTSTSGSTCPTSSECSISSSSAIPEQSGVASSASPQPQRHSRVRFAAETTSNDACCQIHTYPNDTPVDELWFSRADYKRFAQAHVLLAKGLRQTERHSVLALCDVLDACRHVPMETNLNCLTRTEQDGLEHVFADSQWIGLEETVVGPARRKVDERRSALLKAVQKPKSEGRLRIACERLSRPGRLWARCVAQAQWAVEQK